MFRFLDEFITIARKSMKHANCACSSEPGAVVCWIPSHPKTAVKSPLQTNDWSLAAGSNDEWLLTCVPFGIQYLRHSGKVPLGHLGVSESVSELLFFSPLLMCIPICDLVLQRIPTVYVTDERHDAYVY